MSITPNTDLVQSVVMAVVTAWHDVHGYAVSPRAVKGRNRRAEIRACRQLSQYILRMHYGWTLGSIGTAFGMNHATVIHSCNAVKSGLETGSKDVAPLTPAMSYLEELEKEADTDRPGEDNLFELYMMGREREKRQKATIKSLRGLLMKAERHIAELEEKVEALEDDGQYIKPLNWSEDEKRRLKEVRDMGLTEVR